VRIALRELIRRPGRFLMVGGALVLLVVLLVVLGGFLDGLTLSQTGAYRAQGERLWVLSQDSELQLPRSRLSAEVVEQVTAVDGVSETGGIAAVSTTTSLSPSFATRSTTSKRRRLLATRNSSPLESATGEVTLT